MLAPGPGDALVAALARAAAAAADAGDLERARLLLADAGKAIPSLAPATTIPLRVIVTAPGNGGSR